MRHRAPGRGRGTRRQAGARRTRRRTPAASRRGRGRCGWRSTTPPRRSRDRPPRPSARRAGRRGRTTRGRRSGPGARLRGEHGLGEVVEHHRRVGYAVEHRGGEDAVLAADVEDAHGRAVHRDAPRHLGELSRPVGVASRRGRSSRRRTAWSASRGGRGGPTGCSTEVGSAVDVDVGAGHVAVAPRRNERDDGSDLARVTGRSRCAGWWKCSSMPRMIA